MKLEEQIKECEEAFPNKSKYIIEIQEGSKTTYVCRLEKPNCRHYKEGMCNKTDEYREILAPMFG
jgi:hypothetical protein